MRQIITVLLIIITICGCSNSDSGKEKFITTKDGQFTKTANLIITLGQTTGMEQFYNYGRVRRQGKVIEGARHNERAWH
jgi:uncharacterized lipoprotein NlpE involved in copper resistance